MPQTAHIRIGTSGWYYKHWRDAFYPADLSMRRMLSFYVQRFDTVEINNSFYRLPDKTTFEAWREATPKDFCFAVKANRYLTHIKRLNDPEAGLNNFMPRVERLQEKLGPILFQLPPHWHCNTDRLAAFLAALPGGYRYSFELRNPSWHTPAVYDLLRQHKAAFCIFELVRFQSPMIITADFTYVRLHGPKGAYQGNYRPATLDTWAQRIRKWRDELKEVYLYFDNDQASFAAQNALELKQLL